MSQTLATVDANLVYLPECEDPFASDGMRWMGDERILFESGFPHHDSKFPHASETFLNLLPEQISDDR